MTDLERKQYQHEYYLKNIERLKQYKKDYWRKNYIPKPKKILTEEEIKERRLKRNEYKRNLRKKRTEEQKQHERDYKREYNKKMYHSNEKFRQKLLRNAKKWRDKQKEERLNEQ